jgi:O-antigen/teichoic acid export membrane protein
MGLGITATKHVAEYWRLDPARAGRIVGLSSMTAWVSGSVIAAVLFVLSPWLSRAALNAPHLAVELRIAAVMMFFGAVNGSQAGVLSGFEAFKPLAVANLIRGVAAFPLVLAGALAGGLRGAVMGYAILSVLNYVVHQYFLRRECRLRGVPISYWPGRQEWTLLWRFSVPVLVAGLSYTPAVWWSNAHLAVKAGYSQSGIFQAAFQWQVIILFFSSAISRLGIPVLASIVGEQNAPKYRRFLRLNFVAIVGCAVTLAIVVIAAAPLILKLYGAAFATARVTLILIGISAAFSAVNVPPGQVIWSLGATRAGVIFAFLPAAYLVIGAYCLAQFGAVGLAWAYVLTNCLHTAVTIPFMYWLIRNRTRSWKPLVVPETAVA